MTFRRREPFDQYSLHGHLPISRTEHHELENEMTEPQPDIDPSEAVVGPIPDRDVEALEDNLRSDPDQLDVRVEVTEASEQIGTGTDR